MVRLAIPSEGQGGLDGMRAGHFGHCDVFTCIDVENGQITQVLILPNKEHVQGGCMVPVNLLAEAGVNALHPLQARACRMDAETLARDFKGRIAFVGGIDTQELLVHGTPEDVRAEVRRVKSLLGPNLVVSPSHEALLPNVSPENVVAMAEAALE